jgi:hypothetical protein
VATGRSTPRDALRHSSTGLVEVVSYAGGRALPETALLCAEIPESLLPPDDLAVRSFVYTREDADAERASRWLAASHNRPSTSALDACSWESDESAGTRQDLSAA